MSNRFKLAVCGAAMVLAFGAGQAALAQNQGASSSAPPPGQGGSQGGGGRMWAEMDVNKDGAIDKTEAKGRIAENFDAIDADKDGKVTREEAMAYRQKMGMGQGGGQRQGGQGQNGQGQGQSSSSTSQ